MLRRRYIGGRRVRKEKRRRMGTDRAVRDPRTSKKKPVCWGLRVMGFEGPPSRYAYVVKSAPVKISNHGLVSKDKAKNHARVSRIKGGRTAMRTTARRPDATLDGKEEAARRWGKNGFIPVPLSAHLVNFCPFHVIFGIGGGGRNEVEKMKKKSNAYVS
jgi:hypothetical protein